MIVGDGSTGHRAARTVARVSPCRADVTLLNPTHQFLYTDEGNDVKDTNDVKKTADASGEHHPSPEDGSQSIDVPTPDVGRDSGGEDDSHAEQSSPEDGSQSITAPTPQVGQHSSGPAAARGEGDR
ncbi:hypothetical protein JHN52_14235 [Streptomyces sp. MBT97]|uniref:hypothetical protein n=1 Tax=Streptomyces sp. MBT97 TaxID=2800411 RepID=UPI00190C27BF|nr:hypothetical protein [Streptomyces sp. MBT97]MBK3634089.1 hypothetical protein [Streptomyces sp. MBT97]